jgi:hypothetical protein
MERLRGFDDVVAGERLRAGAGLARGFFVVTAVDFPGADLGNVLFLPDPPHAALATALSQSALPTSSKHQRRALVFTLARC